MVDSAGAPLVHATIACCRRQRDRRIDAGCDRRPIGRAGKPAAPRSRHASRASDDDAAHGVLDFVPREQQRAVAGNRDLRMVRLSFDREGAFDS